MLLQETAWWLSLVFLIGDKLVVGIENALVAINSRIVGHTETDRQGAGNSLTLKLTGAYSRATGLCRVALLGVCFRRKVRGDCKRRDGWRTHYESRLLDAPLVAC
jgi:hypothetical protein